MTIRIGLSLLLITIVTACSSDKQEPVFSGNPLFNSEWYADPEIAVFDDEYWIFPTVSAPFKDEVYFDAFSSKDLVNWKKHKNIVDTSIISWADSAMWAPAIIKSNDKYFFFFSANDIQRPVSKWWNPTLHDSNEVGGIGIAIADKPSGPYIDYLGKPLIGEVYNGAQPIDQFIFKDKDGQFYIYYGGWGKCNVGILSADFKSIVPFEDGKLFKEITPDGYVEGSVIFVRDSSYYMMWSEGNWTNDSYRVAYGKANSPFGPFERIGTVLESDSTIATGAGHHSVFNYPNSDEWYIVYHRRPIPNKHYTHRVTCIDRMYFNEDGTIKPIVMTNIGVKEKRLN